MQWESDGSQSSFISHDMAVQMESERETKKMDTALARWAYYNPESAWTYSGDSLIVLITT